MEPENSESDHYARYPNLKLAQLKFKVSLPDYTEDVELKKKLLDMIVSEEMGPYYEIAAEELGWNIQDHIMKKLKDQNAVKLAELDKAIDDALENLSTIDVKQAYLHKANYLCKIGDKENTIKSLSQAYDNTVALGCKLENIFKRMRLGLFFMDLDLMQRSLQQAEPLVELGADWQSRNCFNFNKALHCIAIRNFDTATDLLVSAIATFVCTEIMAYADFIKYTVLCGALILKRGDVKKLLIDNPEIQQALHYNSTLREYLFSLHECEYRLFYQRLADIEVMMKEDMLLHPHYRYYIKEMRITAYDQLLSTYMSLGVPYMASQFGVSEEFIEDEVSKFIAAGRLNYKIDKVSAKIVNVPLEKNSEVFKAVIKQGDLLLNHIHKLGRVINI
ncbi:unnamed protein product [Acanthoscelides obtectus]|uniref:26S proteasome non-ATPase regulatory subunit 6 n=2 Tax=Acanthoscelides obtectus TaxID=200917 RepID=A0A9P0PGK0_ACAOB|nr:unnamed protein product [Acanthoscelides obtectus]CAK1647508.1 26S proteasome non-ATPase regulatory subunit 6 [Acanthoscelides obtectus]